MRVHVAQLLGAKGDRRAAPVLYEAFDYGSAQWRLGAARVIASLGDETAAGLVEALSSSDRDKRAAAALAIGERGGAARVPGLIDALDRRLDSRDEESAAKLLGDIGDRRAVPALMDVAKDDTRDVSVRSATFEALGRIGDDRAVPMCLALLEDKDWAVRKYASYFFELYPPDERALRPLIKVASTDERFEPRRAAAWALDEYHQPEAIETLLELSVSDDPEVRRAALGAIGDTMDPRVDEVAVKGLAAENPRVREQAVNVCWNWPSPARVHGLLGALASKNVAIRRSAASSLGVTFEPSVAAPLSEALADADPEVRMWAALSLAVVASQDCVPALVANLDDGDMRVRAGAAFALGVIGGKAADDALAPLLDGKTLKEIAASYREMIVTSDPRTIPALAAALGRHGTLDMAEDYWHCWQTDLSRCSLRWGFTLRKQAAIRASADRAGRPKWSQEAKPREFEPFGPRLAQLKSPDPKERASAARTMGNWLAEYGPREGASIFDERPVVVVKTVGDPTTTPGSIPDEGSFMSVEEAESASKAKFHDRYTREYIEGVIQALIEASRDPDDDVRRGAAQSLGSTCDMISLPALERLLSDKSAAVRWTAVRSIGRIKAPAARALLVKAIDDKESSVRLTAIYGLKDAGADGIEGLRRATLVESTDARIYAAYCLSLAGGRDAARHIEPLLDDKAPEVVAAAALTLTDIGATGPVDAAGRKAGADDLQAVADDCRRIILAGDEKSLPVLVLALGRHGTDQMARVCYFSGNETLRRAAVGFDDVMFEIDMRRNPVNNPRPTIDEIAEPPGLPKWPGAVPDTPAP